MEVSGAQQIPESLDSVSYMPSARVRRKYLAKKLAEFLVYTLAGLLLTWEAWPGLTAASSVNPGYLGDPDFWIFAVGVFMAVTMLVFLVVVTWNQRLVRIEGGRLTWPFPFRKRSGARTRYVLLEEISEVRRTAKSSNRPGADLVLRDGTQLFLPEKVLGVDGPDVLEKLTRYVDRRTEGGEEGSLPSPEASSAGVPSEN